MMNCICCKSNLITASPFLFKNFYLCRNCGLIFKTKANIDILTDEVVQHYKKNDPHQAVGLSKKLFFEFALNCLESKIKTNDGKILDVGCGYGYFLKMASKKGWKVKGVEITENAAIASRSEFGDKNIFNGVLNEANFEDNYFDAATLWDVLVMVNNPYEELKECNRILKKNGIIAIRVRNITFQKLFYYIHMPFKKIYLKFGIKHPTVFHPFCFSPRAIKQLLKRSGFINIRIENSPLTSGAPYGYGISHVPVQLMKTLIHLISGIIFKISSGRLIIGPSLLIWAEKP